MVFRIDDTYAAADDPGLPVDNVGAPGFFRGAITATGLAATRIRFWWLNMVQEELRNFVVGLGGVPVKGNNGQMIAQLLAAFPGLIASGQGIGSGAAGTTGYIKLPGGMILQWIRNKTATADGTGAFLNSWVFPTPFKTTVLGYSYVATNENASNSDAGTVQAGVPTLAGQPVAHLRCAPGSSVAFSGFVLGI